MKKAFITKLIAGQYVIKDVETKEIYDAKARGKLRALRLEQDSSFLKQNTKKTKKDIKVTQVSPKVGDYVYYEKIDDKYMIDSILPRENELIRPDVANIDQVLLVFSVIKPEFSFNLLDKFLLILEQNKLSVILVVSKIDLIDEKELNELKDKLKYYEKLYPIYYINSKQKIGFDVLTNIFKDKLTVLAGQTGVGKSTLMNALLPELNLKTQEISEALGRGKHTTRHSELYEFNDGYIADTPGFSKLELAFFYPEDIKEFYPDFMKLSDNCKFGNKCVHINEPSCGVKMALEKNEIPKERYDNYVAFYTEIKNQKDKY
ncbi:Putative ribosome biogenesis GTPase RsgA [Alteracholeplasma palmae J233]|uniref:Small ribosomal subunit biogenesis GTPase RsgA n=1 Tax=Alteracholeplasma palmae (strain ATCC 49389 / J233) TaxID=1318466 RepID=U4KK34_ALTPJ|nr:ribosome small subunit-dependent GTPase A [Alteracholeplasma palmae]CCV63984.1 Putative ribosome biogenesis GTPase RsgA [Alteracholeplasma palmae J233]